MTDADGREGAAGGRVDDDPTDRGRTDADRAEGPVIKVADDHDWAALTAARDLCAELKAAIEARGVAHWATTGGSTPLGIYRAITETSLRDEVDWRRVHIWWGDDRYVPENDPLSNVIACDEVLLGRPRPGAPPVDPDSPRGDDRRAGGDGRRTDGVPVPDDQVHRIPIDEAMRDTGGPDEAAAHYAIELQEAGLEVDDAGYPILDVILLGLGPDGHVMSVFPDSPVWDRAAWAQGVAAPSHVAPHVPRVTLHPACVTAARHVIVVAYGRRKAEVVAQALAPSGDPRALPARIARRPGALWILDREAASELPGHQ